MTFGLYLKFALFKFCLSCSLISNMAPLKIFITYKTFYLFLAIMLMKLIETCTEQTKINDYSRKSHAVSYHPISFDRENPSCKSDWKWVGKSKTDVNVFVGLHFIRTLWIANNYNVNTPLF